MSGDHTQPDDTPQGELSAGQLHTLATMLVIYEGFLAPERLTLGPALMELVLVVDDYASGRRHAVDAAGDPVRSADRRSLVSDVQWALEDSGLHIQATITPSLRDLRVQTLSRLADIIQDPHEAAELVAELRSILTQLGQARTLGAAWADLLDAVADDGTPNERIALRTAQLVETFELHGREWSRSLATTLSGQVARGELADAERLLHEPPFLGAEVAWMAFGNAHLRQGFQRLGVIQFFDQRFSIADVRDGCPELAAIDDFEPAPELTDELVQKMFFEVHAQAYVLARIELAGPRAPSAPLDHPVRRARQLAEAAVEAAGFLHGGSQWVLLEGGAAFGHGNYMGTLDFEDSAELEQRHTRSHPTHELTGYGLTELPAQFVNAIRCEDLTAMRALMELRWHQQASKIPSPAMRVTQRTRAFETQWAAGSGQHFETWEGYVRHYLRDQWCWQQIRGALFDATASIEHPGHPNYLIRGEVSVSVLKDAYDAIMTTESDRYSTYTWKPGMVLQLARQVGDQYVAGTIERRRWRQLDRVGRTGPQAAEWVQDRRRAFDALLNRAVRQRNAIVHGLMLAPPIVETIDPFLDEVGGGLVRRWIDAAGGGMTVEQSLETSRDALRARFDDLASQASGFALWQGRP